MNIVLEKIDNVLVSLKGEKKHEKQERSSSRSHQEPPHVPPAPTHRYSESSSYQVGYNFHLILMIVTQLNFILLFRWLLFKIFTVTSSCGTVLNANFYCYLGSSDPAGKKRKGYAAI